MASEFISLNEIDTKELRKKLGLPITKGIKYLHKEKNIWYENAVVDYRIVEIYQPSGAHSLLITLDTGKQIRILADYLADMQNPSFVNEPLPKSMEMNNAMGKRIQETPSSYIVVDLETTGLNHNTDDIIEIGAIKYVDGKETDRYSTLVRTDKFLSEKIKKLTGITNDMLSEEGVDKATAIKSLSAFLGNDIVIGHNFASFDRLFLEDAYQDVINCHFSNDFVDTKYLAQKVLPDLKSHKLENLAEEYDIDYSKAHRATEDCIINHLVYEYLAFGKILDESTSYEYQLRSLDLEKNDEEEELVLVKDSEFIGWKAKVKNALNKLIDENNLPKNSLCLMGNVGRQKGVITSYSICIYEPDLIEDKQSIERNSIVTRITEGKLKSNPDILTIEPKNQEELKILKLPEEATVFEPKKASPYIRINQNSEQLIPYLVESVSYALENYTPKASTFACCAKYEQCSDAKKCIHANQLYAKACEYRKNLEAGKIFYGKNKNI